MTTPTKTITVSLAARVTLDVTVDVLVPLSDLTDAANRDVFDSEGDAYVLGIGWLEDTLMKLAEDRAEDLPDAIELSTLPLSLAGFGVELNAAPAVDLGSTLLRTEVLRDWPSGRCVENPAEEIHQRVEAATEDALNRLDIDWCDYMSDHASR